MADVRSLIQPSSEARCLYGQMVARSDEGALSLQKTLELSMDRLGAGHRDGDEIFQLEDEGWISPAEEGGWLLS